ncbi:MAG: PQQ-like beta-propeller repeat protein, partial [Actinobacteria bacterium]|nr:PQQ-like beta-propeller repeat protein [Actinomycetota bacterium]
MSRPRRVLALASVTTLAVATLTALTSATTGTSSAASATGAFGSPTWAQFFPGFVSQSAPVATSVSGTPTVAVGDQNGVVHMFRLANGTAVGSGSGWATPGGKVLGALSTDGTRLYVPDSPSGRSTVLRAYNLSNGSAAWSANGCGSASGCMELSGMTVDPVGTIYTGGNAQSVYALVAGSGVWRWSYLSSDSTNATPAVADLYGNGQHEIVYADDQTPNSAVRPVAQSGGHLRIFNSSGRQICNANVTGGPAHPGSFDSSPAVDLAGGTPLIAVGTGASGASPNRVLVFDDTCQLQWTSPALPGATVGAPALADVNGNGQPLAVEEVASGSAGTPVVTELDLRHRVVVRQRTLTGCADFHPGTASSVV